MIGVNDFSGIYKSLSNQQLLPGKQSPILEMNPNQTKPALRLDVNFSVGLATTTSTGNGPLDLAYQAAIDSINEAVAPYLGDGAIQRGYEKGIDVSPDATASRIVSLATGLFSLYEKQNPDIAQEEARSNFVEIISSGVQRGFSEAKVILSGLGVLEGSIESNIDLTFNLVMEGFADFESRLKSS